MMPEDNNNCEPETSGGERTTDGRFNVGPAECGDRASPRRARKKVSVVTFVEGERKTSIYNWDPSDHNEPRIQEKLSLRRPSLPQRSLRHYLTREKVPSETNYRLTVRASARPTLEELMSQGSLQPQDAESRRPSNSSNCSRNSQADPETREAIAVEKTAVKFGWFEGVYLRCLLNIWGVMLFLRLTWVVGQTGILEGLAVVILANIVTVITTVSMSAVSTNGQIGSGGVYYMISRSLGPEFGGAIGLMFTVANSISVSMYIIGFCESLRDMLTEYVVGFEGVIGDRTPDVRLIGSVTLVVLLAVSLVGMEWVTRVQKLLLVLLVAAQVDFVVGSFMTPTDDEKAKGFVGFNAEVAASNMWSSYRSREGEKPESFFSVFAVFFPAVTGIVAGANMSGDLKDPGEAIPKGTLLAIGTTLVGYIVYVVLTGFVTISYASGVTTELSPNMSEVLDTAAENITRGFDECFAADGYVLERCVWGTAMNQQMMQVISAWGPLIYAGCFAATLSSAISSLEGAPRVLQALAKDEIFPGLQTFSVGHGRNNDPFRAYIAVFAISLICILIGDLNYVSSLLSNFFVAAYALVNFSVFHASVTNSPGWRPSFKYYNKWLSLLGTILCITVMFLMESNTALITFIIIIILYVCVCVRKPNANWGSSTQAQSFVTALKASQGLVKVNDHIKNYRPKVLVLCGEPASRPSLVDFGHLITKKISLLSTLHIVPQDADWKSLSVTRQESQAWLLRNKIKAFHSVTRNNRFSEGVRCALELHGLSKLAPNMVLVGFKEDWVAGAGSTTEYYTALHTAMDMRLAVGILRQPAHRATADKDKEAPGTTVPSITVSLDSGLDVDHEEVVTAPELAREVDLELEDETAETEEDELPFRSKKVAAGATIDIYWLYDDGGLTLLVPHILHTRRLYADCRMRLFFLCSKIDNLDTETRAMVALLAKFRIEADDVIIISDATQKPSEASVRKFSALMEQVTAGEGEGESAGEQARVTREELDTHREKTNFYLRMSEVTREFSMSACLVVMTLPVIRLGAVPAPLYLGWLDTLTRGLPPTLLIRGNQESVLTFYS